MDCGRASGRAPVIYDHQTLATLAAVALGMELYRDAKDLTYLRHPGHGHLKF